MCFRSWSASGSLSVAAMIAVGIGRRYEEEAEADLARITGRIAAETGETGAPSPGGAA